MNLLPAETRRFLSQFARQILEETFPNTPTPTQKPLAIHKVLQFLTVECAQTQGFPGFQEDLWESLLSLEESVPVLSSASFASTDRATLQTLFQSLKRQGLKIDDAFLAQAHEFFLDGFPSAVINKRARKSAGAFYTPPPLAKELAKKLLSPWRERIEQGHYPRICDPSAGHGQLLQAAVEVMIEFSSSSPKPKHERFADIAEHALFAYDTNQLALDMALTRFILKANQPLPKLRSHFISSDPLLNTHKMRGAFDLFFGNPPYGLKHPKSKELGLSNPDSYGAFLLLTDLLKDEGQSLFIVSDTFLTLESHHPLRRQILEKFTINSIQFLPSSTFRASVETLAISLSKDQKSKQKPLEFSHFKVDKSGQAKATRAHECPQSLLQTLRSKPISTALPSLLELFRERESKGFEFRERAFVWLGDHIDIRVGLQTGDNLRYLKQLRDPKSIYEPCDKSELVLPSEIQRLSPQEKLSGVNPQSYGGRHFIPFDKGGKSLNKRGQLADYYRQPSYAIDWSEAALTRMKEHKGPGGRIQARIQNMSWFFRPYIVASRVGAYSPTFRLGAGTVFDSGCTGLF
ncbi:MAG: N-6 DNA methylase, partial [Planctomycetota bacterium]|nr:N-6 DNA methylase [Planctomycetota bacterium]